MSTLSIIFKTYWFFASGDFYQYVQILLWIMFTTSVLYHTIKYKFPGFNIFDKIIFQMDAILVFPVMYYVYNNFVIVLSCLITLLSFVYFYVIYRFLDYLFFSALIKKPSKI